MRILILNAGSSSLKFKLINLKTKKDIVVGQVENIGRPGTNLIASWSEFSVNQEIGTKSYYEAFLSILTLLNQAGVNPVDVDAVGHRVVHGGERFKAPAIIQDEVLEKIRHCVPLAPLHNPANLEGIEQAKKIFSHCPHVAVFDTAFHQTIPEHAYIYPLPRRLYKECGIRKYGFHGTSHRYVASKAAQLLEMPLEELNLITAHLGNGCSACAIKDGKSVDTTMGLTPLEGLVMGTRSGNVDPGLHEYLHKSLGWTIEEIHHMLNKQSGLLGISGVSSDMREVTNLAKQGHHFARLAVDIFCYHLAQAIAGLSVNFKKLDALVFTGGIGEHSTTVRKTTLEQLRIFGFELHEAWNEIDGSKSHGLVSKLGFGPAALVIKTNEELQIAMDVKELLNRGKKA